MKQTDYAQHLGERAQENKLPSHVAIIMDGNGRWAKKRMLSRTLGHRQGKETVHTLVSLCLEKNIPFLTLFAFGQENWKRPSKEVRTLFRLLYLTLKREIDKLHEQGVCLRVHGALHALDPRLQQAIDEAQRRTALNKKLVLNLMVNYSGRWDLTQAFEKLKSSALPVTEAAISAAMTLSDIPEPDLFIRTGGVQRLSNFILWELAYTELYFTECAWPDFNKEAFNLALEFYARQERRFGLTSEQIEEVYD